MSQVRIVATGGTIQNTADGLVSIEQVLATVPEIRDAAEIDAVEATRLRSGSMRLAQWFEIGQAVVEAAEDPRIDGIVVTHGTFTVEETAFFLHLTMRTEKPIVFVCAQRMRDARGTDGARNLIDAVRVAAAADARAKGVLVVLHEEVHSAREVVKTNQRPGGFESSDRGLVGHVERDRVSIYQAPTRRHTHCSEFDFRALEALPRVDVLASYVGADDLPARACLDAGARGLVVNGFAFSGRPAADQAAGLERIAADGVPVVLVNRGGGGRIPSDYDDPFIRGDTLVAQKARILLMLGLTRTAEPAELQRLFDQY